MCEGIARRAAPTSVGSEWAQVGVRGLVNGWRKQAKPRRGGCFRRGRFLYITSTTQEDPCMRNGNLKKSRFPLSRQGPSKQPGAPGYPNTTSSGPKRGMPPSLISETTWLLLHCQANYGIHRKHIRLLQTSQRSSTLVRCYKAVIGPLPSSLWNFAGDPRRTTGQALVIRGSVFEDHVLPNGELRGRRVTGYFLRSLKKHRRRRAYPDSIFIQVCTGKGVEAR